MNEREKLEVRIKALQEARELVEREDRQTLFCEDCECPVEAPLDTSPILTLMDERIRDLKSDLRRMK
jgi:hypothetical protein